MRTSREERALTNRRADLRLRLSCRHRVDLSRPYWWAFLHSRGAQGVTESQRLRRRRSPAASRLNQGTSRRTNRGTSRRTNREQASNQPGNEPSNQPGNEPSNQPGNRPSNQPGNEPSNQPGAQPVGEPSNRAHSRWASRVASPRGAVPTEPLYVNTFAAVQAISGAEWIYEARLNDPVEVTWSLATAPEGATVSDSGVVRWTPTDGTAGDFVLASASDGRSASQAFSVAVTVVVVEQAEAVSADATVVAVEAYVELAGTAVTICQARSPRRRDHHRRH